MLVKLISFRIVDPTLLIARYSTLTSTMGGDPRQGRLSEYK